MQLKHIIPAWLLLISSGPLFAAPLQPREDINPGLLYWQATSIFPEKDETMGKAFHEEGWPRESLPAEYVAVARRFDPMFLLLRRAARMNVPCDWGFDLSDGPEMVMPNLVRLRETSYATVLRARVALDEGRQDDAREELIAMLRLARHSAIDGALVQAMIEVAIEAKLLEFVANHFGRFTTENLQQLVNNWDSAPPRVTVATSISTERVAFYGWFLAKVERIRDAHPRDDAKGLQETTKLIDGLLSPDQEETQEILRAAEGTMAGMVAYVERIPPFYDEMLKVAHAPPSSLRTQTEEFKTYTEEHPHVIASALTPNISKARNTELKLISQLMMLRAAVAYRAQGVEGFNRVPDPFGEGPFQFESVDLDGGRKGFELRSQLIEVNEGARQVFVE